MVHVMGMLPGFVVGCIVVFAAWGISALMAGASRRKENERNDGIISSIESTWTDADSMITSFRSGQLTETAFKNGLAGKIEAINRLYKPSLHQLDIFFIKYTEKLLEEYRQLIAGGAAVDRFTAEQTADQTMLQEAPGADDTTSLRDATDEDAGVSTIASPPIESGYEATPQEEAVLEPAGEMGMESTIVAPAAEEEPVVAAMTEAENQGEPEIPIETYLDMEPGTSLAEEPVLIDQPGIDERPTASEEQEQPIPMSYDIQAETPEDTLPQEVQPQEIYDSTTPQQQEEAVSDEGQFEMSTSVYPAMEDQPAQPQFADETMVDQPAFDYSAESAEASEATEAIEQPPRMPPPFAPPSRDRGPGYKRDETVEPATIYDIEAETIIADRNEIIGTKKPAKEEPPKNSLGITGDDISTQLDNYFKL
jgi:hypothetical protein